MKQITAKDIMNRKVLAVREGMTIHELADFLSMNRISGAPVLGESGKIVGVVSLSDIVRNNSNRAGIVKNQNESDWWFQGWEDRLDEEEIKSFHVEMNTEITVGEIMTPLIYQVKPEASITEMADVMIRGRIHRLIVATDDRVQGIVSTLDMLKAIRDEP